MQNMFTENREFPGKNCSEFMYTLGSYSVLRRISSATQSSIFDAPQHSHYNNANCFIIWRSEVETFPC
jgi:hypothetical protein